MATPAQIKAKITEVVTKEFGAEIASLLTAQILNDLVLFIVQERVKQVMITFLDRKKS